MASQAVPSSVRSSSSDGAAEIDEALLATATAAAAAQRSAHLLDSGETLS